MSTPANSPQPARAGRRTEPSAWLCASREQPILQYVPAAATDIRVLFARVRRELRQPMRLAGGVR